MRASTCRLGAVAEVRVCTSMCNECYIGGWVDGWIAALICVFYVCYVNVV